MKKQLLLAAFLMGSFFTATAQQSYSFETSEGYTLGPVVGQNGWTASAVISDLITVAEGDASNGTNALSVFGDAEGLAGNNNNLTGSRSEVFTVIPNATVSFDVKFSDLDGSNFYLSTQSIAEQKVTARIMFENTGDIAVLDTDPEGTVAAPLAFFYADGTYEANTWYNVRIEHNFTDGVISYFLDDELIYESDVFAGTAVDDVYFGHDNSSTNGILIDNITVTSPTVGTKNVAATQFSVFPNPATNVINVTNADNTLVNNVAIVDINGRTVKSVKFDGVADAQVNISDLASGVYMVTIASENGTTTKKIVKN